eukprot:4687497-Prymnesium_polylepis.1
MRSGPVAGRERRRVALVFFGKHSSGGRSQAMGPSDNASVPLMRRAHALWMRHLVRANAGVRFDVFAHSWSPEVASEFAELWEGFVVAQAHEPTHFTDDTRRVARPHDPRARDDASRACVGAVWQNGRHPPLFCVGVCVAVGGGVT